MQLAEKQFTNSYLKPKRRLKTPKWVLTPRVSVLIPVYNHKSYLRDSILSLLDQEIENLSIHILDDGSTDNPFQVISDLMLDKRISYNTQENKGLPEALNNLKKEISGKADFTMWHSADNKFTDKLCLKKLSSFLVSNPDISLCYSNVALIDENNQGLKSSSYRINDQKLDKNADIYLDLNYIGETIDCFNDNFINSCFLSRARLEEFLSPYQNEALGFEDYVNWLMLSQFDQVCHIGQHKPMYAYRIHKESLSSNLNNEKFIALQEKYFSKLQNIKKLNNLENEIISQKMLQQA